MYHMPNIFIQSWTSKAMFALQKCFITYYPFAAIKKLFIMTQIFDRDRLPMHGFQ